MIANGTAIDMEEYLKPEFDLSQLDEEDLKIATLKEISEVYNGRKTSVEPLKGFPAEYRRYIMIGFSLNMKPIYMLIDHETEKARIQMIRLADEIDIEHSWCKK